MHHRVETVKSIIKGFIAGKIYNSACLSSVKSIIKMFIGKMSLSKECIEGKLSN